MSLNLHRDLHAHLVTSFIVPLAAGCASIHSPSTVIDEDLVFPPSPPLPVGCVICARLQEARCSSDWTQQVAVETRLRPLFYYIVSVSLKEVRMEIKL